MNNIILTLCLLCEMICSTAYAAPMIARRGTIDLLWSADVSSLHPPSSPLKVYLGSRLNITCPANGTSNIWIQNHRTQYDECDCNATGVENPHDCTPDITTRQICQDEVMIKITFDSKNNPSALSFEPDTTYYLISYSAGDRPLAGYKDDSSGGECLRGFRMALQVLPADLPGVISMDATLEPAVASRDTTVAGPEEPTYNGQHTVEVKSQFDSKGLQSSGTLATANLSKLISFIALSFVSLLILLL